MDRQALVDDVRLSAGRALGSDFFDLSATDAERAALAQSQPPVTAKIAQNYAAWRRSVLYAAAFLLFIAALLEIAGYESAEDGLTTLTVKAAKANNQRLSKDDARRRVKAAIRDENLETIDTIPMLNLLKSLIVLICIFLAGRHWSDLRKSRRLARRAWYVMLGIPLAIAIYPWAQALDLRHLASNEATAMRAMLSGMFGLMAFFALGPAVIATFAGMMRASITLKTLLHESAVPGYVTALFAPVYAIVIVVVFALINQIQADAKLPIGVGCMFGAAMVYLWRASDLLRSHTKDEAVDLVRGVRRTAFVLNAVGIVLITLFLLDMNGATFSSVATFLVTAGGNLFVLVVVGCDFILALLRKEYEQAKEFQNSKFAAEFEAKMAGFTKAGMSDLSTAEPAAPTPPPPPAP